MVCRFIIIFCLFSIYSNLMSNEAYKIKIMGKFDGETVKLPNEGTFNMFTANAAFSDSDGNFGDAIGRGVRETDKNNKIINLYSLRYPDGSKNDKTSENRSDIKAEQFFDILHATGVFSKYLGYK